MGATLVVERRVTPLKERMVIPPVEKKVMVQVGETEETPQAVGTGERPQVVGMWVIPQVVGTRVILQVGAAVASPHLGGPPTGNQVGSLLSLQIQHTILQPCSDLLHRKCRV
jgi:hypothetical protein